MSFAASVEWAIDGKENRFIVLLRAALQKSRKRPKRRDDAIQ
jgi:hypothetical protein